MATLTKREAIRECKRLWKELEKSGLTKGEFLFDTRAGRKWLNKLYNSDCPLCEYAKRHNSCRYCPLFTQYNKGCFELGYAGWIHCSPEWFKAIQGLK